MLDAVTELVEILVAGGMPSPDTLAKQRQARFAVSVLSLTVVLSVHLLVGASSARGWVLIVLLVVAFAAGWALAFSIVDVAKELPSLAWLSIAAVSCSAAAIWGIASLALGVLRAAG